MTESTGRVDRDSTLALLWRHTLGDPQGTRGPRQKVTVDQVVDSAIAIADDEGLDALSMRSVAERLGIGAMSLYTYVESKSQLIELMVDQVTAELPTEVDTTVSWRERLERMARLSWHHYRGHPWLLLIDTTRAPLGPGISRRYEYQLQCIEGIGLGDLDMDAVITLLTGFVAGAARAAIDTERGRASGQTDEEWWEANLPVLERAMRDEDYPVAGRVGTTVGQAYGLGDPEISFEFGLARLLDGVEAYVARVNAAS
jgi:AcrR family transcriptional regulator